MWSVSLRLERIAAFDTLPANLRNFDSHKPGKYLALHIAHDPLRTTQTETYESELYLGETTSHNLLESSDMNKLVHIALRRPYTFVVMSILLVLFGGLTLQHMPTDVFPNITTPVTSVVWIYSGLLPQQVEGRITYLFERFVTATVEGIKYMHSHSYFGSSITNIFLQDGVDVARAEADIVGIAQNVVKALPPDISPPMVMRLAPSSIPVAMLHLR